MRRILFLFFLFCIGSCGSGKKKAAYRKIQESVITVSASEEKIRPSSKPKKRIASKANRVINTALSFSGTRYKYGGTTKRGMDCSGLLYVSFSKHDVKLPRASYQMALKGRKVKIKNVEKGDLLFFKTSRRRRRINHVGMVVSTKNNEVKFIHASSSRGVIVSSLREGFWDRTFVKATRVL